MPEVIYKLKNLETLLIANNQLSEIDAVKLQSLTKLASLDLQNNNISMVPPELGNCTSLRYVITVCHYGTSLCTSLRYVVLYYVK